MEKPYDFDIDAIIFQFLQHQNPSGPCKIAGPGAEEVPGEPLMDLSI